MFYGRTAKAKYGDKNVVQNERPALFDTGAEPYVGAQCLRMLASVIQFPIQVLSDLIQGSLNPRR